MNRSLLPLASLLAGAALLSACADRNPAAAVDPSVAPALSRGGGDKDIPFAEGHILVRYAAGAEGDNAAAARSGKVKRKMRLERTVVLDVPAGEELATADSLSGVPGVEFAEPDYMIMVAPCEVGTCETVNDPFVGYKWDLNNDGFIRAGTSVLGATAKVDADIDWLETYDYLGAGFAGTAVIGIIDTGIRKTHQDLAGRVIAERNFATGYAADFVDDRNSHGTHVAGIAAARGNNGLGVSGVAYGANIKLINAKACEIYRFADGTTGTSCPTSSTADAIVWAVDQGANVLNISLGGSPAATAGSAAQRAALQYARSKNVLPFCSTGNDNYPGIGFPARFPECVAVGATNWNDGRASYSNYGPQIAITAPGGDSNPAGTAYSLILAPVWSSTSPTSNTTYGWKAGTSMSTPQVTGLAALLIANGMTDVNQVLARIKETADDLGPAGWDPEFGAGRINVYRAITGKDPNAPPVAVVDGPYTAVEGQSVAFSSAGSIDPNGKPVTFAWSFGDGSSSREANPSHTYADNGTYAVTLTVTDQSGLARTTASTSTIANAAPAVSSALSAGSIVSGGSVSLTGSFSDAGTIDAPWTYAISWGNGITGGTLSAPAQISGTRQFCAAGTYAVRLSVTDKDGGTGSDVSTLTVVRGAVSVGVPGSFNLGSNGSFPVTIFSRPGFNPASIDPATVTLGDGSGAQVPVARRNNGTVHAGFSDENGDGVADLVLHFDREALVSSGNVTASTTQLVVLAGLSDGCLQVRGTASISVH